MRPTTTPTIFDSSAFKTCLIALLLTLCALLPVDATADRIEDEAQQISYELLSPFCPGRALADCPSPQATDLKQKIRAELRSGKTKDQVSKEILDQYGQGLSALPSWSGINALAWVLPLAILLIGGLVVAKKALPSKNDEA